MAVPEAAVDEYDGAVFGEDDVGRAGKGADIQPVTIAPAPQLAPYSLFGTGVLRADVRHTFVPLLGSQKVGHPSFQFLVFALLKKEGDFGDFPVVGAAGVKRNRLRDHFEEGVSVVQEGYHILSDDFPERGGPGA